MADTKCGLTVSFTKASQEKPLEYEFANAEELDAWLEGFGLGLQHGKKVHSLVTHRQLDTDVSVQGMAREEPNIG